MANYQSAYAGAQHDLYTTKQTLINLLYPIGAIYLSTTLVDPSIIFGGTWRRIEGKFLLGADNEYVAGSTGGSSTMSHTHTLSHTHTFAHTHTTPATTTGGTAITINQMPSHSHAIGYRTNTNVAAGSTGTWTVDPGTITNYSSGACIQKTGGGQAHTHPQVATTTNSQSSSTTSEASTTTTSEASNTDNMPPYLAVYMWERIA